MIESTENLISSELQVEPQTHGALIETAKWAKFIAISGFIFSGLIFVASAVYVSFINKAFSAYRSSAVTSSAMIGVLFYVVAAIMWIIISVIQFRFASKMQHAIEQGNQELLNQSFENLKLYYRVRGIITIITLLLSVLGILGLMAAFSERM
jgi:uncharacterized membrane protein